MTTQAHTASPTKLQNGSWGATVPSLSVEVGDIVTITTRGGKSWDARISKIVWSGKSRYSDGSVTIVATESVDSPTPSHSRSTHSHGGCSCTGDCCSRGCRCDSHCNCLGGNIYDC